MLWYLFAIQLLLSEAPSSSDILVVALALQVDAMRGLKHNGCQAHRSITGDCLLATVDGGPRDAFGKQLCCRYSFSVAMRRCIVVVDTLGEVLSSSNNPVKHCCMVVTPALQFRSDPRVVGRLCNALQSAKMAPGDGRIIIVAPNIKDHRSITRKGGDGDGGGSTVKPENDDLL